MRSRISSIRLRADAAERALAARLVLGEVQEVARDVDHAVAVVEHDQAAGAHDRAGRPRAPRSRPACRPARAGTQPPDGPPTCTALNGRPVRDAAADLLDDLADRDAHRHLDQAAARRSCRPARRPWCPCERRRAQRGEGLGAVADDPRHAGQRLDVVDERRLARASPACAGYGGRSRGMPRRPSSDWISAVSSPQTNAPAPSRTCSVKLNALPRMRSPSKPAAVGRLDGRAHVPHRERVLARGCRGSPRAAPTA